MSIPKLDPATIVRNTTYCVMRMKGDTPTSCAALYETLDDAEAYVSDMNRYTTNAYRVYEVNHDTDTDTDHELKIARENGEALAKCNDKLCSQLDAVEKVLRATYHFVVQGITDADDAGFEGAEYRVIAAFMQGIAQGLGVNIW